MRLLTKEEAAVMVKKLEESYPDTKYYLNFKTPLDLLVAAILSAQTRDEVVNKITPEIFSKFKSAKDYANASEAELLKYIKPVSFAGNKAKNIINAAKVIDAKYGGKVPKTMDELISLPGVGRKTANTILINAYGIVEGIPVDTWVIKLSPRLGLSKEKNPDKIELDLMKEIDRKYWHNIAYVLKRHGKELCKAIPECSKCPAKDICPRNGVEKAI
ncbi:MAG: endonuclease III domain-containing protein [Candidatus Micrarchaeia archaeon]